MPHIIPKNEIPPVAYTPIPFRDGETTLFAVVKDGVIGIYGGTDEIRFAGYDEIIEWMATATVKKSEKPLREVKPDKPQK